MLIRDVVIASDSIDDDEVTAGTVKDSVGTTTLLVAGETILVTGETMTVVGDTMIDDEVFGLAWVT
jgi:hypothetical protein